MRIFLLLAAMLPFLSSSSFPQKEAVIFAQNSVTISFPNSAAFSTSLSSSEKISDIELLYGTDERTCSDVQALALPEFTPGKQVNVKWEWDMRDSGALPPGTEIWWQWKATTEKGDSVTSEKQTTTWLDKVHPWQVKETEAIRLHYYAITGQQADEFIATAVDAMKRLESDTGMVASGEIDLFMYPNAKEMRDALLYEPTWTGGMAFTDYNKIVLGIEQADIEWTKRTEAHELTHALVGNYTFTCLWTTPTWLEEGLAVYGEGSPDKETQAQFDEAKANNEFLSFRILSASFSEDSDKANLSYSQSYYMVNYLIETYGRDRINRLLKTLSSGKTVDDALNEVYGFDLVGFENEWRKFMDVPAAKGSEDAIKPTGLPTEIPTMQPISGVNQSGSVSVSQAAAVLAGTPTVAAGTQEAANPVVPTSTPIPLEQPTSQGSSLLGVVIIVAGLLILGIIVFLILRAKNKKNSGIIAFIILFIATAVLGTSPVNAEGIAAQSTKYPQIPTATLYTPPLAPGGMFSDPKSGVTIKIPSNVSVDTSKAASGYLLRLSIANDAVIGHMFSSSLSEGQSLQDIAHKVRTNELNGLIEQNFLEDKEIKLDDGTTAWLTVSDAKQPYEKMGFRISLLTMKGFTAAITLMLYSTPDRFDYYQDEMGVLNMSLQVSAPVIKGFARDELMVTDSGETDNPAENDPATARSSGGFSMIFSGLVTYDSAMNLAPDLAESWDVSEDGLVYTFHLHPEAVFHNMRPVTANDVVYSWERAADPLTNSGTVMTYMGDIQGIKERHEGKADHISGLKVMDAHTLQVTLEKPVPYFLLKLTYPTSFIVDKDNVESSKTWYRTPNGTGPFRQARWESRQYLLYERFDSFYGPKPEIKAILFLMYQGTSQQLYEQGEIDYAYVGYGDLIRFTDPTEPLSKQLQSNVNLCTSYITMDIQQPPFDDIKVRQAFAMAIDKEKYIQVISHGGALEANGLFPPALPGFDKSFKGIEFDPEKARTLLKESKYGNGEMPPITFSISSYGSSVPESISAMTQMWEENLGVKITILNIDPEYYQDVLDTEKHGQLISEGWCADYPDPENFADVLFHTGAEMNRGHYSNSEVDKLLEAARVEVDVNKRMEMYSQAEKLIVMDAPAIFLTHSKSFVLVKPYLQGFVSAPLDIPFERFLSIDGTKFKGE